MRPLRISGGFYSSLRSGPICMNYPNIFSKIRRKPMNYVNVDCIYSLFIHLSSSRTKLPTSGSGLRLCTLHWFPYTWSDNTVNIWKEMEALAAPTGLCAVWTPSKSYILNTSLCVLLNVTVESWILVSIRKLL